MRRIGPQTQRKRRKEARPDEIIEAALASFLELGFEATRLDDVARRAGVAKGTVYLYFESKEHLFRAVVQQVTDANVQRLRQMTGEFEGSFAQLVPKILAMAATSVGTSRTPSIAKLVLREANRFPDLARIWLEDVAAPMFNAILRAVENAQARGEVRSGDAQAQVLSLLSPMIMVTIARDIFEVAGFAPTNLESLAHEHGQTTLYGLLASKNE